MASQLFVEHSKYLGIASLISKGTRVLDIGCGGGQLGAALREKECVVDGIDIALDRLVFHKDYNLVWEGNVENFDFNQDLGKYNIIVFSDILEHLASAEPILRKINALLAHGGRIIISLPNVAFFINRWNLILGRWDYTDEGILDRTHLKFFTFSTSKRLIKSTGYQIHKIVPQMPIIHSPAKRAIFNFFMNRWPGIFAIGWIFETSFISDA
jgi:2-polyprenyl-3-methyl-5-hydroxy-6-metoxy-1,4-benzoquinol methylase